MIIDFSLYKGVIYTDYVLQVKSVNQLYFKNVLKRDWMCES